MKRALPTHLHVRPGKPNDAGALATVFAQTWSATYQGILNDVGIRRLLVTRRATYWHRFLSHSDGLLVALNGDEIVGYVTFGPARTQPDGWDPGPAGEIYELYVAPLHQGSGHGGRLFAAARAELAKDGRHRLLVWALSENTIAEDFYLGRGGNIVATGKQRSGNRMCPTTAFIFT
ncbi:MAG: GNAT family N-acetyltransferase [Pseudomonadota bacterium]